MLVNIVIDGMIEGIANIIVRIAMITMIMDISGPIIVTEVITPDTVLVRFGIITTDPSAS